MRRLVFISTILLLLSTCSQNKAGKISKSEIGAISGGLAGALLGSTIGKGHGNSVAVAAGAVFGSIAGSELGNLLDQKDIELQKNAQANALEYNKIGNVSTWKNPDSNASGYVIPTKTFVNKNGENCREYTQTIKIGNKVEEGFGIACRRSNGAWEIVK